MGSKEDVATRIEADTKIKIEEMNRDVSMHKKNVSCLNVSTYKIKKRFPVYIFYMRFMSHRLCLKSWSWCTTLNHSCTRITAPKFKSQEMHQLIINIASYAINVH